jgi:C_GCAxxG_C_C family probable redox protein
MGAFGGGLGSNGEVCGALVGALATIGLKCGRLREEEPVDLRVYLFARELVQRFREGTASGSILCRDIAGVDWSDPKQVKAFREGEKRIACGRLTGETARMVGELLERP